MNTYSDSNTPADKYLSYASMWDGEQIHFTITNLLDTPKRVSWFGTPFADELLAAGEQKTLTVHQPLPPSAGGVPVEIYDPVTGAWVQVQATTLGATCSVPTLPGWGLLAILGALLASGIWFLRAVQTQTQPALNA